MESALVGRAASFSAEPKSPSEVAQFLDVIPTEGDCSHLNPRRTAHSDGN